MKLGRPRLTLMLVASVAAAAVLADNPKAPPPDADLFEFLGSVDSAGDAQSAADDGSWLDYLSQTDINKVAKAKANNPDPPARPRQVTTGGPPVSSGDKNYD